MKIKVSINQNDLDNELSIPLNFDSLCSICGSDILENEQDHILPCNHKFHYDCLLKFLKFDLSYPRCNKCPYCRQEFLYLPLLEGMKPIKSIHKEYNEKVKLFKFNNHFQYEKELIKCKGIYLSGKQRGLECNNFISVQKNENYMNQDYYCRYHQKQSLTKLK